MKVIKLDYANTETFITTVSELIGRYDLGPFELSIAIDNLDSGIKMKIGHGTWSPPLTGTIVPENEFGE